MGRRHDARASLVKIDGPDVADAELATIETDLEREAPEGQARWGEVFSPGLRRALCVGLGLAVFQQVTGINAIIYYANEIFAEAGFTTAEEQAKATLCAVGVVNVVATFIAVAWVDRFGRRPLLFTGLVGMALSLAAVGLSFVVLETSPANATTTRRRRDRDGDRARRLHRIVRVLDGAGRLDQLISEIYPNRVRGPGDRRRHRRELVRCVRRRPVLPLRRRRDRRVDHVLPLLGVLRPDVALRLAVRSRDDGPDVGADPGRLAARGGGAR